MALYLKTALVGDSSIGKTSLMVKYVEYVVCFVEASC